MAGEDSEMVIFARHAGYEVWYEPTMRVVHVVAGDRLTRRDVIRMQRGFGESAPILWALTSSKAATFPRRLGWVTRSLAGLLRLTAVSAGKATLRRDNPGRRLRLAYAFGRVLGGMRILFHRRIAIVSGRVGGPAPDQ